MVDVVAIGWKLISGSIAGFFVLVAVLVLGLTYESIKEGEPLWYSVLLFLCFCAVLGVVALFAGWMF